jgi:hypothetical protein
VQVVARHVSSVGLRRRHSVASLTPEARYSSPLTKKFGIMPLNVYTINAGRGTKTVTEMWSGRSDLPVANWIISKLYFISYCYEASILLIYLFII